MALIGGGVAALGLLALLFLASRRSTRGYISSVVGKAFGSAASVKSTKAVAVPPSAAAASAANLSPAAFGKGVLLDNSVRQRTGMSWYRVTRAQLLAAPEQAGVSEVSPWSALVVDGVAVPYEEVARVRMDEGALEFIVEHGKDTLQLQHLRMFTRPKITNPNVLMETETESKPSAVLAARKWLANAE